ncbi:MAG: hypothetical protein AAF719_14020 [Pseudomonadota bacterium]
MTDSPVYTPPPLSALNRVARDAWLSFLAILAVAFSHIVTGIYGLELLLGLAVVYAIVVAGYALAHAIPIRRFPDLFWVSMVAMVVNWPGVPGADWVRGAIDGVNFLPTITPLMAFAALGLGHKEVQLFRRTGFQFVLISLLVFGGTFLGSALIAQLTLILTNGSAP